MAALDQEKAELTAFLQATELLRGQISEVRMVPTPDAPGWHEIELVGNLAGILLLAAIITVFGTAATVASPSIILAKTPL